MKKVKSYTNIWSVEKILYSINDFKLPFPITFTQIAWFLVFLFITILFSNIPPLSMINNALIKYFAIPSVFTWLMCKKTFDGKKPYSFLKSIIVYFFRPKITYANKPIKLSSFCLDKFKPITIVRSDIYEISDKIH